MDSYFLQIMRPLDATYHKNLKVFQDFLINLCSALRGFHDEIENPIEDSIENIFKPLKQQF